MKTCNVCGETKESTEFPPQRRKCKTCHKEYILKWQRENRAKVSGYARKSRANNTAWRESNSRYLHKRRSQISEVLPEGTRDAMLAFYGVRCEKCGSNGLLALDHVVPVSKSGSNSPKNLQLLCKPCNSSKYTSDTDYRDPYFKGILVGVLYGEPMILRRPLESCA